MSYRDQYEPVARQAAASAGIDVEIFVRQISQESGFDPNAVSPAGATGIAQIVPRWHPGVDPWDPVASLYYAAQLDRQNLDRYGSWELALAAYNAGGGAVDKYGGVPPYEETQRYIAAILGGSSPAPAGNSSEGGGMALAVTAAIFLFLVTR